MYYKEAGPILDYIRNLFKKETPQRPVEETPLIKEEIKEVPAKPEELQATDHVQEDIQKPEVPFTTPEIEQPVEETPIDEYIEFPDIGEEANLPVYPYDGETSPFEQYQEEPYKPPVQFNEWVPPTDVTRFVFDYKKDYSLGALLYLKALGYKDATWYLSEAHPKYDVCDERAGNTFNVDFLIEHSYRHSSGNNPKGKSYNPPSPIFSISHPGCLCYLVCLPPSNINDIPDNAPGLPIHAKPEELVQYKQLLFNNLKPVVVDSLTLPPLDLHQQLNQLEASVYTNVRRKEASTWLDVNNAVEINTNFLSKLPLGFTRPIFKGEIGVEIARHKEHSKVYILQMNRIIMVPTKYLDTLETQRCGDIIIKRGDFILIDGSISIVYRVMSNKDVYAFLPDFKNVMKVDQWECLKRV